MAHLGRASVAPANYLQLNSAPRQPRGQPDNQLLPRGPIAHVTSSLNLDWNVCACSISELQGRRLSSSGRSRVCSATSRHNPLGPAAQCCCFCPEEQSAARCNNLLAPFCHLQTGVPPLELNRAAMKRGWLTDTMSHMTSATPCHHTVSDGWTVICFVGVWMLPHPCSAPGLSCAQR